MAVPVSFDAREVCHNRDVASIRKRALLIGLIILLVAMEVLRAALHLAGGAIRIILLVVIAFALFSWATGALGRGRKG